MTPTDRTNLDVRLANDNDDASFRAAIREFRVSDPVWTFASDFDEAMPFSGYVRRLEGWSQGKGLPSGFVPSTFLLAAVGHKVIGRVSLRHVLNEYLLRIGGHVGFGVVPSERRKGYATEMLRQTLPLAAALGIERLLLTCDEDNVGSRKVIEANGGVLENVVADPPTGVPKRRYWINVAAVD